MTTSVGIIAHNESANITKCLAGVLRGSSLPTEIVLVAHNCTDDTINRARDYLIDHCPAEVAWHIDDYHGPEGIVHARIRLFALVKGDLVASIDGDCIPNQQWLYRLLQPLINDPSITGVGGLSLVWGHLVSLLMSLNFFFLFPITKPSRRFYFWGSNFACRRSDYMKVGGFEPLLQIRPQIGLQYWAEDLYLSLALARIGSVVFTSRAVVWTRGRTMSWSQWLARSHNQDTDRIKLQSFMS